MTSPRRCRRPCAYAYGPASWPARRPRRPPEEPDEPDRDRKSTRLNSSHSQNSYAVFCLKTKMQVNVRAARNIVLPLFTVIAGDNQLALAFRNRAERNRAVDL